MPSSAIYQVGDWQILPELNALRHIDEQRHLEPRAIELLLYFAQRPNEVISRSELLEQLWPGVIVSDDALTQVVIKLRKALGDSSRSPRYIQTIPKRGYRLVAEVQQLEQKQKTTPLAKDSTPLHRKALWLLLGSLTLITAWLFIPLSSQTDKAIQPTSVANTPQAKITRLAVMPFKAMQTGEDQQLLAQSLAADLRTDLSQLSSLIVVDLSNAEHLHSELNYRIVGDVQKLHDRLLIHLHLLNGKTGEQIWAKRIDRPYVDLIQAQQALSVQLVDALAIQVDTAEQQRLARPYTQSLPAYENFQRAQELLLARDAIDNRNAREFYWAAIEADPQFARAYAGLALSYAADYRNQWTSDGQAALQRASEMAQTARQIDPELAAIYWVLGYIDAQRRKHQEALQLLSKALELDQSYADALALMGGIKTYMGKPKESIDLLRRAMRLRPAAGSLYYLLLGRAYYFIGDQQLARLNLRQAINRNPENLEARLYMSLVLQKDGFTEEAEWEKEEALALVDNFDAAEWLSTYPMSSPLQRQQLLAQLLALGL